MSLKSICPLYFRPDSEAAKLECSKSILEDLGSNVYIFEKDGDIYAAKSGEVFVNASKVLYPLLAFDQDHNEADLGSKDFLTEHNLKYPYASGGMTQAIASVDMVIALAREGFMSFFGTGGLGVHDVEAAVLEIKKRLGNNETYGINMISIAPQHDQKLVDLFLKHGVRRIEVAGAITLSAAVVEYRLKGLHKDADNNIVSMNKIFAKVSREEVATLFMSPPPDKIVKQLLESGRITQEEASLAQEIPVAEDIIAEADSGGHTDGRPAILLYQNMVILRDQLASRYKYKNSRIRIGAAGGIATPQTVLAAFTLGADFVLTGSVNQSCIEAGISDHVKRMLSQISMSDVATAPSADMFEMGSKVQVMSRGLMFHLKANKLYDIYMQHKSIDEISEKDRKQLEERTFGAPLEVVWENTKKFFMEREPEIVARAEKNSKFKMALIFRSYLGLSSKWAQKGEMDKKVDFQIFCGPAMGAFNRWVKDTYLEAPENRNVVAVAKNLICGALYLKRLRFIKDQGIDINQELFNVLPKEWNFNH